MVNSRNKGNTFERFCCTILKPIFSNIKTSRLVSKETDDRGIDLVHTGDWAFQCKRYARKYPNIEEALEMQTDAKYKAVIHKRDHKKILVTMDIDDFLVLLRESEKVNIEN
jgi:hypothetical protein